MELFKLFGTIALNGGDEVNKQLNNTGKEAKDAAGGFTIMKGAIADLVSTGFQKLLSVTTKFIGDAARYQSSLEQYSTSFEVMTGSADKAADVVERLKKIGAETPFELTDLADTTQLLMNYGLTADDAIEKMMMLGDISQGSAEKMNRISMAYGQMSSAGKVSLEDVKQMIEAGFNPLQEISQTTGESMASLYDRISKGTISVDEITASMTRSTSEGGKYFGSMEKQSQTLEGRLSTLKDTINASLGQALLPILETLANTVLPKITEAFEKIDWEGVGEKLGRIVGFIIDNWDTIKILAGVITGIAVAMGVLNTVLAIQAAIAAANPITWIVLGIIAAITLLVGTIAVLVKHWDKVKAAGKVAVDAIKSAWSGIVGWFNDKIVNPIKNLVDKIKGFFKFKFEWPKIKAPKFSIKPQGWKVGDLLKGTIPKLGITWAAEGGIFDEPTLFNTPSGMLGVGEAGAEAVAPIDKLTGYVQTAVRNENNALTERLDNLVGMLSDFFPQILSASNKQLVLDSGALVGQIAPQMNVRLGDIQKANARGM